MPVQLPSAFRRLRMGGKKVKTPENVQITRNAIEPLNCASCETDFTIRVQDARFPVHKSVLSSRSDYFRALFDSGMQETHTEEMEIEAMPARVVETALGFIYGKEVHIPAGDIQEYLDIVEIWLLTELKEYIEQYLGQILTLQNCLGWFFCAKMYSMKQLEMQVRELFQRDFTKISQTEDFTELDIEDLKSVLTDDVICAAGSDVLLQSALRWVLANEERKHYFSQLLDHLRLTKCHSGFLKLALKLCTRSLDKKELPLATPFLDVVASTIRRLEEAEQQPRGVGILMVGGRIGHETLNERILELDVEGETLEDRGPVPGGWAKFHVLRCVTAHGVFSCGGCSTLSGDVSDDCNLFDVRAQLLIHLPPSPVHIDTGRVTALGSLVYMLAGKCDRLWSLDLEKKQWTKGRSIHSLITPALCSVQDALYVFTTRRGKRNNTEYQLQRYDPVRNTLSKNLSKPKNMELFNANGCNFVAVDCDLYVVGGLNQTCGRLNAASGEWANLAQPLAKHRWGGAVYVGGKILLCGGRGFQSTRIEAYDVAADRWDGPWEVSELELPSSLFSQTCIPLM